jgi:succinate-semialdehyde dehydrogenase/glutarate-semialdehyde dehydrogenase
MATAAEKPLTGSALEVRHSWIGNRAVPGRAGRRAAVSPASGAPFAEASLLDAAQLREAVAATAAAAPGWGALPFRERGALLLRARDVLLAEADDLAQLIAREQGKPPAEAKVAEIFPSLETLAHLARHAESALRDEPLTSDVLLLAHKEARVVFEPFGAVLVITPWNYPLYMALSSVAAALAAGNAVVLKPAPATTLVGLRLGEIFSKAGFPPGVVNVVAIDDALAPGLVENEHFGKVVFVGSVATGRKVMASAAKNVTPVLLELGGKDAAVVCRDADLERAARGIVWGAFMNAGQTCVSVERVYVEAAVAEPFVARVVELTRELRMGDPLAPSTEIGPMTLERQRAIVEDHVADALARGARVLTGGATPPGPGFFYPPTVLVDVDHGMRVMRDETFGPLLPIMAVPDLGTAIRLANDSEFGLTASGWTRSRALALRLQRELRAGVVTINDCVSSLGEPAAPYGGMRRSGIGRSHGALGLRELSQAKFVSRDGSRKPLAWWYPYGEPFARFMAAALPALHSRSLATRLARQLSLATSGRFWSRLHPLNLLRNLDKLF